VNGVHDMGGMDGFGAIDPEPNEPVFHAPWEGRVNAIMRSMGYSKAWNLDMFRNAREHQLPAFYLASSYYKSWERTIETLLLERGLVTGDELTDGRSMSEPGLLQRRPAVDDVPAVVKRGAYGRPALAPALFKAGDAVRTKNINPATHTRLPRYARGRRGTIERDHGCHVFPDSSARGAGDNQQWLYTVVFEARELWGDDADPTLTVSIDAFEPYLERL
jgi:nitrile hydratase beta subunit